MKTDKKPSARPFPQFLGIICLILCVYASWIGKTGPATFLFLAFAVFMLFSARDWLVKFKAGLTGIEAETREVIARAESTIVELQAFGKTSILTFLSLLKRVGRIGSYSRDEEEEIERAMRDSLRGLRFSDEEVESFLRESEWYAFTCFDYARAILSKVDATRLGEGQRKALEELRRFRLRDVPSPDKLASFIRENDVEMEELQEWLADYRHYLKTSNHRRPDEWKAEGA